jgi:hypothetical protein
MPRFRAVRKRTRERDDDGLDDEDVVNFVQLGNPLRVMGCVGCYRMTKLLERIRAADSRMGGGFDDIASEQTRGWAAA